MRRILPFVAIFLLLITAAPVLACVTGSRMDHEESACCQTMHGQCGSMAKMGCCRTALRTEQTPQIATVPPTVEMQPVVLVGQWIPRVDIAQVVMATRLQLPEDYFPPGLMTARTTVLRI